jgi:hypothetical protein
MTSDSLSFTNTIFRVQNKVSTHRAWKYVSGCNGIPVQHIVAHTIVRHLQQRHNPLHIQPATAEKKQVIRLTDIKYAK